MTERELFDAIGRLPEQYRAEALAQDQQNEIDALFDGASHTDAVQYRTEPVPERTDDHSVVLVRNGLPQTRQKSGIVGLTAIAASVALIVGVFAWKMRQDSEMQGNSAAMPGSSAELVQESDLPAETVTALPEDSAESSAQMTEQTDSIPVPEYDPDADEMVTLPPDRSGRNGGTNLLGGHGVLKTVMNYGGDLMLEDDENWYTSSGRRISKTKLNDQGHLYGELLCQTPGCPHSDETCPYYLYRYSLRSDGKELYLTMQNEFYPENTLMKQSAEGMWEPFFSLSLYGRVKSALKLEYVVSSIDYMYVLRLGDTDTYYICAVLSTYNQESGKEEVQQFGLLLDKKSDRFAIVSDTRMPPLYDAEHEILYLSHYVEASYPVTYSLMYYDLKAVSLTYDPLKAQADPAGDIKSISGATLLDGKLYYYNCYRKFGQDCYDLNCFDPAIADTDSRSGTLQKETQMLNMNAANGRLYYRLHSSVGADKICSCAPDLTDEQVVYQTSNAIRLMYPFEDPSLIRLQEEQGYETEIFLVNGEPVKVDHPYA